MLKAFGATIDTTDNASWIQFQEHLEQIVNPSLSIVKEDGRAKLKRREFQRGKSIASKFVFHFTSAVISSLHY